MTAQHTPMFIDNVPGMFPHEVRLLEERAVVFVGNKADLHAFFLVRSLELAFARDLARVALGQFAQRK